MGAVSVKCPLVVAPDGFWSTLQLAGSMAILIVLKLSPAALAAFSPMPLEANSVNPGFPPATRPTKQSVEMPTRLYEWRDITIWRNGDRHYVDYDAGSITELYRRDEITAEEAAFGCQGSEQAVKMLLTLQRRLVASGVDPYRSNNEPTPG